MNRIRYILLICLCAIIAVLGIGYLTIGDKKDEETTAPETTVQEQKEPEYITNSNITVPTEMGENDMPETTTNNDGNESETTIASTTANKTNAAGAGSDYEYAYAGFNPSVATVDGDKWNLLVVNQSHILPDGYTVKTASVTGGNQSLDYRVAPHYNEMVAAAKADGISLMPVSGYRTYARQEANFNRKINYYSGLGYSKAEATRLAAKIVLMPGTSEHNAGLAMDFGTNGNSTLDENFGTTKAYQWLSAHAADYGFILRYPKDKQDITKVTYEPWHWRYVGAEYAKKIKASGQTLEEYFGINA